jgi:hypothetical protein
MVSPLFTHGMLVKFSVPGNPTWLATLDRLADPNQLFAKFANEDKPWHIDCCWAYYCKQNNLTPKDHVMLSSILSVEQGISLKILLEAPNLLQSALNNMMRPNPFHNIVYLPNEIQVLVDGSRRATLEPLLERKGLVLRFVGLPGASLTITPSEASEEEDYENTWFARMTLDRPGYPTLREVLCLWSKEEIRALNSNVVVSPVTTCVLRVKPEAYGDILNDLRAKETKLRQEITTLTTIRDLQVSNRALIHQQEQLITECSL